MLAGFTLALNHNMQKRDADGFVGRLSQTVEKDTQNSLSNRE